MTTLPSLTAASLKMLVRDRAALVATVVFPVVFVLVFSLFDLTLLGEGLIATGSGGPGEPGGPGGTGPSGGLDYFDFVLPGLLANGLLSFTVVGMAGSVARYRETRILRRMVATPLAPWTFLVAQVVARLVLAVGQVALLLGLGVALGAEVVGDPLLLLVLATLGNLSFLALGFAVAGRVRSVDAANNLAGMVTAPLMFLSGMFFPLSSLPDAVARVGELLPITPLLTAMRAVALEDAGLGDLGGDLWLLLAWVPVAFLLARLSFRMAE